MNKITFLMWTFLVVTSVRLSHEKSLHQFYKNVLQKAEKWVYMDILIWKGPETQEQYELKSFML